jgi:NADH-ubiquinone oxidoreductase chain 1
MNKNKNKKKTKKDNKIFICRINLIIMNTVGYYGILQPFADALKLILKETVIPSQSNKIIFYLAPVSTLVFSLLGWAVIPFGQGLVLSDLSLGILYTLALSSLGVIGLLFSVWLAMLTNSKFSIKKI